jgi:monosaccharide-transporting ATPase
MTSTEPLLVMEGISKAFPGVRALEGASLRVGRGEVHAVMGQNGAGNRWPRTSSSAASRAASA